MAVGSLNLGSDDSSHSTLPEHFAAGNVDRIFIFPLAITALSAARADLRAILLGVHCAPRRFFSQFHCPAGKCNLPGLHHSISTRRAAWFA
ncbi:hypothetical protein [Noviherbaspirillum album]|uniref:hypothetical protein n=1 Tax=Noviherbaspirillum album TaxID=3080276 RepID=UPI002DD63975|nr:hypothetical protein [Noviherbaspirillum sp. CPCC 100848]